MRDAYPDAGAIRFRKHRDAGSVLNATLVFIRENARELITSYLAIVAPIAAAAGLASILFVSRAGDVFSDPQAILDDPLSVFGPTYFVSVVLGALTTVVALAAAGGYVRLYRRGEAGSITPSVLWDEARDLILPLLGLTLAVAGAFIGSVLVNVVPCLGTLAWAAFLVWVFPTVSVMVAARVLETSSVRGAWDRARSLVKGSWGFAAGALLLAWLVAFLLSMAVGVVGLLAGSVLGVGVGFDAFEAPAGVTTATAVLQAVLQVVSYTIYLVPFLAVYLVHGRLAEELDGTTVDDDLDVLSDAGFGRPTPPVESQPSTLETPFGTRLGGGDPSSNPPPLSSTPPAASGDGGPGEDAPDGGGPDEDAGRSAGGSGFRGGGFGA